MTKQEILAELEAWRDKAQAKAQAADELAEQRGQEDDYQDRKREADRLYYQWKGLRTAIEAIVDVDEEQP